MGSQHDVVLLAAGEILHGSAEALLRQGAHIDLQAFQPKKNTGLVRALTQHLLRFRMVHKIVQRFGSAGTGSQQIHIADRFAPATEAAGGFHLFNAGQRQHFSDQFIRHTVGKVQKEPACALTISFDAVQHLFLELGTHPGQFAQFVFAADALQVIDRFHAVMFVKQGDALRAESLNFQQL